MFTDECRVVLYPKINPQINVIRLSKEDRQNIHTMEVNKKRTFYRPKFEVSLMIAGGISKYGLSNLVFCSGTQNSFSYRQFLLFIKDDMDKIKVKNNLTNDLLFQQDNASCHKSRDSMEAIEVIFGKNKLWWPANSPDLSPIETVWAILKQELSKRKNSNLEDLRNNILDIWTKFPKELCSKIVSEFDEKIIICQKEGGKILNKAMIKKYRKINKKESSIYDWETLKMEKKIRIVYNNKIIELIKKKCLKNIKSIQKNKIKSFNKDFPKGKNAELNQHQTYNEYIKLREYRLNNINYYYEKLISNIKNITPLNFINNYLNENLINKKYLINTNLSKKLYIKETILKELILGNKNQKFNNIDEKIEYILDSKIEKSKINDIKKYLPLEIEIQYFPEQRNIPKKNMLKSNKEETIIIENEEDISSKETKYTIEDTCNLMEQLTEKIRK